MMLLFGKPVSQAFPEKRKVVLNMQEPLISGIHHVNIRVPDLQKSVSFYTTVMGFRVCLEWENGVMLELPDHSILEVFAQKTPEEPLGIRHIALETCNVDKVFSNAVKSGCETVMKPADITLRSDPPKRIRVAFIKDPSGNDIELFCGNPS